MNNQFSGRIENPQVIEQFISDKNSNKLFVFGANWCPDAMNLLQKLKDTNTKNDENLNMSARSCIDAITSDTSPSPSPTSLSPSLSPSPVAAVGACVGPSPSPVVEFPPGSAPWPLPLAFFRAAGYSDAGSIG